MIKKSIILIFLVTSFCSSGCLKKIPYEPNQVNLFLQRKGNVQLTYTVRNKKQVAFYLSPIKNPEKVPETLAILYPGIKSVALEWLRFIKLKEDPTVGYLLIDYPGRGYSEGLMNPNTLYENTECALKALANHLGVKKIDAALCLLGHSFGSGVALQYAVRSHVNRIVLVAPFNTLRKALAQTSMILSFITPAQINNVKLIEQLLKRDPPPEITIIHGDKDATLPVEMGRELAGLDPNLIHYFEIPEGGHLTILTTHRDLIFHSLLGIHSSRTPFLPIVKIDNST